MRKVTFCSLALITSFAGAAFCQSTPTVDEIIQKHAQAMGGADKLKSIKSVRLTGVSSVQGMEAPTVMMLKRPGNVRLDLTIQDQTVSQGVNASGGWMVNPFMGSSDPQPMPEKLVADLRASAEIEGPLVDYKAKGNKVELAGKEDVNGKPAYVLNVTHSGRNDKVYLDAATYQQVKAVGTRNVMGQDAEVEIRFSDYRDVNGVKMAHTIEQIAGGNPVFAMTITKVEIDPAIDDAAFAAKK